MHEEFYNIQYHKRIIETIGGDRIQNLQVYNT